MFRVKKKKEKKTDRDSDDQQTVKCRPKLKKGTQMFSNARITNTDNKDW